jgi:hypothetical protein
VTALPEHLLDSIWDAADGDEAEAERLAQRWRRVLPQMEARAERIRVQVRESVCSCELPADASADGRCSRCWGKARR